MRALHPRRAPAMRASAAALLGVALVAAAVLGACAPAEPARVITPPSSGTGNGSTEPSAPTGTPSPTVVALDRIALSTEPRWENLSEPLFLTFAPGDPTRLFIVEKTGRIRVVQDGRLLNDAFLDLSGQVSAGSEQGLLGLAFSPDYLKTGRFYVNYTDGSGNTNIVRYRVLDPADSTPKIASRQRVLKRCAALRESQRWLHRVRPGPLPVRRDG